VKIATFWLALLGSTGGNLIFKQLMDSFFDPGSEIWDPGWEKIPGIHNTQHWHKFTFQAEKKFTTEK
jgi:hypothetical protein